MSTLEPYRDLRAGSDSQRFIVEGALAVQRLLRSELGIESIVCTPSQRARLAAAGVEIPAGVPVLELDKARIAELVGFDFHRGVLACARRPPPSGEGALPPELLTRLRARERLTIVAAEGLADPRNLGALIRNAAAFGVDAVIADARGADPFARLTIRVSVGNVFRVPLVVSEALPAALDELAEALGATLAASTPDPGATPLGSYARPAKLIVMVGNEGTGLSAELLRRAQAKLRIPVVPASDSINVAAATAVLLYELCRRVDSPPPREQP